MITTIKEAYQMASVFNLEDLKNACAELGLELKCEENPDDYVRHFTVIGPEIELFILKRINRIGEDETFKYLSDGKYKYEFYDSPELYEIY